MYNTSMFEHDSLDIALRSPQGAVLAGEKITIGGRLVQEEGTQVFLVLVYPGNREEQLPMTTEKGLCSVSFTAPEGPGLLFYSFLLKNGENIRWYGGRTFSVGSAGCNFSCRFCQNHHISRDPLEQERIRGHEATPDVLVAAALRTACRSLAFTYNEPTVFVELLAATAALGQERGLPSILVSNGFMSPGCLEVLGPLVRAANIDLKAFSEDFYHHYCGARLRPVLDNLVRMRSLGWWLEVTTLILEGLNDGEAELRALARFIRDELGADTPWHVTAFHPAYRMTDHPATRAETLRRCRDIGLEEGLHFVYTGNVFCAGGGDTLCPQCGEPCLERQGWQVTMRTDTGVCPRCGSQLPGVWKS